MAAGQVRAPGLTAAIVLPPREGFSPEAVGAIGLLVHRLVRAGALGTVIGAPTRFPPFDDVPFRPAAPGLGLSGAQRYINGVARVIRTLRPRVIEVHNRPEVALGLVRRFPLVPVVLWLNNDPQGMRGARTAAERTRLLARMTRVVTASDWIRRRLLEGTRGRAIVIPNCLDLPPPRIAPGEKLIVFAGRVVRDKGVDAFVLACGAVLPNLPGWRAQVIGADRFAPDAPDTPFVRALRPQAVSAGVEMRGHQPHAVVLDAMRRAAIVAVPSRWEEPFGLAALEAMACGAALVCSPRGGLPEVAGDTAWYADPDAPGALATALRALALDPARRARMGAAGRARAEGFSAEAAAAQLLALRREMGA